MSVAEVEGSETGRLFFFRKLSLLKGRRFGVEVADGAGPAVDGATSSSEEMMIVVSNPTSSRAAAEQPTVRALTGEALISSCGEEESERTGEGRLPSRLEKRLVPDDEQPPVRALTGETRISSCGDGCLLPEEETERTGEGRLPS